MDHNAIVCFMTDRLAQVQIKMFRPGGQPKVPSRGVDAIFVIDYRWGSMGSEETAARRLLGAPVIDVFYGNGAPSGPNYLLFRMQIGSRTPSEMGLGSGSRLGRCAGSWGPPKL